MSDLLCAVVAALVACPDCPTARDARQMFLRVDLLPNATYAVLPFIVTLAITALIVRSVSHRGASHADDR